ncbi:hypothetical protein [Sediminibacterium soli]|uniref:hypothetical protein n=1 Tax=Sediminibacterium soli TaxID=2698829 RepID=UPI0013798F58|nr:hypothetical protein [Sediminibacterium soli]NCI45899.1 hypothetical protein [Sediminibacterium soli]
MKKLFVLLALGIGLTASVGAQTEKHKVSNDDYKSKVKPTTTVGEKVHNVFSKHKKTSGLKIKKKNKHTDAKTKTEVKTKP